MAPSKDQLPTMTDVPAPKLVHYPPSPRGKSLPGLGTSKDAVTAVFDELHAGDLAKRIFEADGAYVIVQLKAHDQPQIAEFDKSADTKIAELRNARAQLAVENWLKTRCEALATNNKIKMDQSLFRETDDKGNVKDSGYRPCISFR
jgi:hypothetical protein